MRTAKEWVYGVSESQNPTPELWVDLKIKDAIELVANVQRDVINSLKIEYIRGASFYGLCRIAENQIEKGKE